MNSGTVLYGSYQGVQVLRFIGRVSYQAGPSLHRFVDGLFTGLPPTGFVIDLTETQSIDSTNLGLLAHISNRMRERGGPRVTIVSCRQDIDDILNAIGFDEVFDIVAQGPGACEDNRPLSLTQPDRPALKNTMLEAHRTLMSLNQRNHDQFADVVTLLEARETEDEPTAG